MSDLIDRAKAKDYIEGWKALHKYYHPYSKCKDIPFSEVLAILDMVPPTEKTGKWILNPRYGTECSECGTAAFEIMGTPYSNQRFKYCPNCGARMVEE